MADLEQYRGLITDIIKKQAVILGSEIAVLKARNVKGLEVSDDGQVVNISENPDDILQRLVNEYVSLSGQIVKNALGSVFEKYPSIQRLK